MPRAMTLNVRITGELGEHVAAAIGDDGLYENVSEYVRDLIRRDHARVQEERFQALKAELQRAFAVPESECKFVSADEIIARNRARRRA